TNVCSCPLSRVHYIYWHHLVNAVHLTLNLDVAFQMVEVRTGPGLKPLYRVARGPEGKRKRRNAESMRYKWKKEWDEGGEALNDLRGFLADSSSNSEKHINSAELRRRVKG
ncbi:hypothetical protein JB92DRAFT_3008885, partial [Gautieria morchelliformis]